MLILWPVVDEQQQAGHRQALDESVEQCSGLRVDPVQVFEDQEQGLHLAFAQEHPFSAVRVRWRRWGGSSLRKGLSAGKTSRSARSAGMVSWSASSNVKRRLVTLAWTVCGSSPGADPPHHIADNAA